MTTEQTTTVTTIDENSKDFVNLAPVSIGDLNTIVGLMTIEDKPVAEAQFSKLNAVYTGQLVSGDHFCATVSCSQEGTADSFATVSETESEFSKNVQKNVDEYMSSVLTSAE